jgi:hypothetical protein
MMTDWYQKSINALQLNGKGERTQEAYTRAVRMLCEFLASARRRSASKELFVAPSTKPESANAQSPFTRCATATPPICWKRA